MLVLRCVVMLVSLLTLVVKGVAEDKALVFFAKDNLKKAECVICYAPPCHVSISEHTEAGRKFFAGGGVRLKTTIGYDNENRFLVRERGGNSLKLKVWDTLCSVCALGCFTHGIFKESSLKVPSHGANIHYNVSGMREIKRLCQGDDTFTAEEKNEKIFKIQNRLKEGRDVNKKLEALSEERGAPISMDEIFS